MRCIPRRINNEVEVIEQTNNVVDKELCILLTEIERILIKLDYKLIYMYNNKERVYRNKKTTIILDYINCTIETTTSCKDLSNILRSNQKSIILSI